MNLSFRICAVKKEKNISEFVLNYLTDVVQPIVEKLLMRSFKKYSYWKLKLPWGGNIAPMCIKIAFWLTITIINKCFIFENDGFKNNPYYV